MSDRTERDLGIDWATLARHLSGESTAADDDAVRRWAEREPEHARQLAVMRQWWETSRWLPEAGEAKAVWRRLEARIDRPRLLSLTDHISPARRRVSAVPIVAFAATIAAGLLIWFEGMPRGSPRAPAGQQFVTEAGQREHIQLSDGSKITIAPGSRVMLRADYGRRSRDVILDGEAYFVVAHDSEHPFSISAHGTVVRDLGTSFEVRAFAEDSTVRVAVAQGVVEVRGIALRQGDVATVGSDTTTVSHGGDVPALIAWTDGRLVFADVPLATVVHELGRWYDLDITIASPAVARRTVAAVFEVDEPVDQALEELHALAGVPLIRNGRSLILGKPR